MEKATETTETEMQERVDGQGEAAALIPWEASEIVKRKVKDLVPYAKNARTHSKDQVAQIARSIREFGFTSPVLIGEGGEVIAGHGRLMAADALGMEEVPTIERLGLSEAQRKAYRLADNQLALNSGWDEKMLRAELSELSTGFDLSLIGFSPEELADMRVGDDALVDEKTGQGRLLTLVNVTIEEPKHIVERGDHWVLGGKDHLLCVGVMTEWGIWGPLLEGAAVFCPYPGPFVAYGPKVRERVLVMVQPDRYTAGHILDRYAEIYGEDAVVKVKGGEDA